MTQQRIAIGIGVASVAAIATGIGLICLPAGLIAAGLQGLGAAYLLAYFGAGRKK